MVAAAVSPPMGWACGGMVRREILRPVPSPPLETPPQAHSPPLDGVSHRSLAHQQHREPLVGSIFRPGGKTINTLRLWSAAAADYFDFQAFSHGDFVSALAETLAAESLTRVLYPDDST